METRRTLILPDAFEWDEKKREINIDKHRIDFAEAIEVFKDVDVFIASSHQLGEERRYIAIGVMKTTTITVVFTIRDETIRIISSRAARRNERAMYEQSKKESER